MHDVYSYGVIAPSTLIELTDEFPVEGGYAEIARVHDSIGGEAAAGAYVLARLGVATKLDGNRLSDEPRSVRALEMLTAVGVDCSAVTLDRDTNPLTEVVIATGDARTVLGTYIRLNADQSWNEPTHQDVLQSRIVCLDPFFGAASQQVARWCREAEVPYVTVDDAPDSDIARHAEVLVVSEEFATRLFPEATPHEIMAAYKEQGCGLVILTQGSGPLLYQRDGTEPEQSDPYAVAIRDTTGAGDSFRAGIIYGMLRGYEDSSLVTIASAVAALVCQQAPGVINSPSERELQDFLGKLPSRAN